MTAALQHFLTAFAPFLESINQPMLVCSMPFRIVYANEEFCRLTNRNAPSVAGRSMFEFMDERGRAEFAVAWRQHDRGARRVRCDFHVLGADGRRIPVQVSVAPLEVPGAPAGLVVLSLDDVSALKNAQHRIEEQASLLRRQAESLELEVRRRTLELYEANFDAIYMLAVASEVRDTETGRHVRRIQRLCELIARRMGLRGPECSEIGYSAILHDVGKIMIPDSILKKSGPLSDEERAVVQTHTLEGERILGDRGFFGMARRIARAHHENYDGTGYPDRLASADIPVSARIVAVADVYDALCSARVYKAAWPRDRVRAEMRAQVGRKFDPAVAEAFLECEERGAVDAICTAVNAGTDPWRPGSGEAHAIDDAV